MCLHEQLKNSNTQNMTTDHEEVRIQGITLNACLHCGWTPAITNKLRLAVTLAHCGSSVL